MTETKSSTTKTAAKKSDAPPATKQDKAGVDRFGRRSGDEPLEGGWVRIVSGDHDGRVGAYLETVDRDKDGFPQTILVRSRDERNELLSVAFKDVKATSYRGGR